MIYDSDDLTNFSDLYQYLMPELPGCPEALILNNIRQVISDFCAKSQSWKYQPDPVSVAAGEKQYRLEDYPDNSIIEALCSIIRYANATDWGEKKPGTVLTPELNYFLTKDKTVELVSEPGETIQNALLFTLILKPTRTSTNIDAQLFDNYYEMWVDGTLSKLMMMTGTLWYNPQLAMEKKRLYWAGISAARTADNRGYMNRQLRARPRIPFL